jgi:alpha-glucosidase
MVAEPSELNDSSPYFGNGSDMFHMTFDFGFGYFWGLAFASSSKSLIENALVTTTKYTKGAQAAQVIGSHDVPRAWQSSGENAWRLENAMLIQMTTKGTPFVYYGDEVGLRPGTQVVVDVRDAARTPMTWTKADPPMTWTKTDPGHGFTTGTPWIAFGAAPELTAVDAEDADPDSILTFTRKLLAFRRGNPIWGTGEMRVVALDSQQIVAFVREDAQKTFFVAVNLTEDEQVGSASDALPGAGTLVFGDGAIDVAGGVVTAKLPGKSAAIFEVR